MLFIFSMLEGSFLGKKWKKKLFVLFCLVFLVNAQISQNWIKSKLQLNPNESLWIWIKLNSGNLYQYAALAYMKQRFKLNHLTQQVKGNSSICPVDR